MSGEKVPPIEEKLQCKVCPSSKKCQKQDFKCPCGHMWNLHVKAPTSEPHIKSPTAEYFPGATLNEREWNTHASLVYQEYLRHLNNSHQEEVLEHFATLASATAEELGIPLGARIEAKAMLTSGVSEQDFITCLKLMTVKDKRPTDNDVRCFKKQFDFEAGSELVLTRIVSSSSSSLSSSSPGSGGTPSNPSTPVPLSPRAANRTKQQEFKQLADLKYKQIKNLLWRAEEAPPVRVAREGLAKQIGDRWFELSGGEELMVKAKQSGVCYEDYHADTTPLSPKDDEQIEKDLARTKTISLRSPSLKEFVCQLDMEKTNLSMRKILTAFCKRNRAPGYSQGMDHIVLFLLAFQDEEHVFWSLCAIVERLRLPDFYSAPPAALNGFMIDRDVFVHFASAQYPKLLKGFKEAFTNALEIVAAKWFLIAFVDLVPFHTLLFIFDIFLLEGDIGLMKIGIAIIDICQEQMLETSEPLMPLLSCTEELELFELRKRTLGLKISGGEVERKRAEYKAKYAAKWMSAERVLDLTANSQFTDKQLMEFQTTFLQVSKGSQSISKDQFRLIIKKSAYLLEDDIVERFFSMYDHDGSGRVDFRELMCVLSILCHGTQQQRIRMVFDVYDNDNNGFLQGDEIRLMSRSLVAMKGKLTNKGKTRQLRSLSPEEEFALEVQKLTNKLTLMDSDKDGKITYAEFEDCIKGDPELLAGFGAQRNVLEECSNETIRVLAGADNANCSVS